MSSDRAWPLGPPRQLRPGQRTEVWVTDVRTTQARLVLATDARLLEAPNWAPDGNGLLLNGDGLLWRLDLEGGELHHVDLDGVPPLNNDHVLDPTRMLAYVSADDGHIWFAPLHGGVGRRLTHDDDYFHFLHGVSPDGTTLAFVELPVDDHTAAGRLAVVSSAGGATHHLRAGSGSGHLDGPEYSPDGAWIYVNTEAFSTDAGHAQLARVPADGGELERLVGSPTVDWFPHLSPDGELATYLSFPAGTRGHPANLSVEVRLVRTNDWSRPVATYPLFGGQGTLNVNSWSPDSSHFAFVAYPIDETHPSHHLSEGQHRP